MRPKVNNEYYYKGNQYKVVGFSVMKSTLDGKWVEAVQYQRAYGENDSIFTRELGDFVSKFCPAVLEVGMRVIAECMGNVVGIYQVTEIVDDETAVLAVDGNMNKILRCKSKVNSSRIVELIDKKPIQSSTFYVELHDTEVALANENTIENIRIMLIDASHRVCRIDRTSNHDGVLAALTKIENVLKKVYTDFSI